jgi:predicted transcriptional regulator
MKASDEIYETKQQLVHEILRTRREMNMTQKNIEAACGVKQPVIARMERGLTDPQLTTILKVLQPLGKTLAIVPLEEEDKESE